MNYTIKEAAGILRVGRSRLYELVAKYPYYYVNGSRKLFTQQDIDSLIAAMRHEGSAKRTPIRHSSPILSMSHDRVTARVLKLLAEPNKRRKSNR